MNVLKPESCMRCQAKLLRFVYHDLFWSYSSVRKSHEIFVCGALFSLGGRTKERKRSPRHAKWSFALFQGILIKKISNGFYSKGILLLNLYFSKKKKRIYVNRENSCFSSSHDDFEKQQKHGHLRSKTF